MPSRPVLPLLLPAERPAPAERRRPLDKAALLSALLHGGLIAVLLVAVGGGGGTMGAPGDKGVTFVSLANASELPGGSPSASVASPAAAPAPQTPQAEPADAPDMPDPLQAANEPVQPAVEPLPTPPPQAQAPAVQTPQAPARPPQAKPARPAQSTRKTVQTVAATSADGGAGPSGAAGQPSSGNGGTQLASLTPGPVGAFEGLALAARFRSAPPPPPYPKRALAQNQQGTVLVRALVDDRGRAQDIRLYASSGFPMLDRAALEAVAQWDFLPAVRDGRAVAAWVEVPVKFHID